MTSPITTRADALSMVIATPNGTITVGQLIDALQNICDGQGYSCIEAVQRQTGCTDNDAQGIVDAISITKPLWSIY